MAVIYVFYLKLGSNQKRSPDLLTFLAILLLALTVQMGGVLGVSLFLLGQGLVLRGSSRCVAQTIVS